MKGNKNVAYQDAFDSLTQSQCGYPLSSGQGSQLGRVLVIDPDQTCAQTVADELSQRGRIQCDIVQTSDIGLQKMDEGTYELLVVEFNIVEANHWTLLQSMQKNAPHARMIVLGEKQNYDHAMLAMRSGAADYLDKPVDTTDSIDRIWRAFEQAVFERQRESSIRRLKRICKRLNNARLDVTSQIDDLCSDLVNAYDDLAGQISHVTTITEFTAIIQQELDVEDLLRTTLEYFLRKIGPMNAAVFLPGTADDFTLGAYINYDCPRDSADFMLDQLADVIPDKMNGQSRVVEFRTNDQIEQWLGDDAHWLEDSHVVAFNCMHENECLAVFTLFRNVNMSFDEHFVPLMESVADIFAQQLAHVIHVHHRALPPDDHDDFGTPDSLGDDWPSGFDDDDIPTDDYGDLAA